MTRTPLAVPLLGLALVVTGCSAPAPTAPSPSPTRAVATPVPAPEPTPTPTPTPSPTWGTTIEAQPDRALECRRPNREERTLLDSEGRGAPEASAVVDITDEWRVLVLDFESPDECVAVVTNGVRYSHLPDGWTGGYAALDTFLADGPAALDKARSCLDG